MIAVRARCSQSFNTVRHVTQLGLTRSATIKQPLSNSNLNVLELTGLELSQQNKDGAEKLGSSPEFPTADTRLALFLPRLSHSLFLARGKHRW